MTVRIGLPFTLIASLFASTGALADHNSVWGEGWANMPNDIHNTRLDTMDDNDDFVEFVRMGSGAQSVNRFAIDSDTRVSETPTNGSLQRGQR